MKKEDKRNNEEHLKGIVNNLPDSPGCYQYLNSEGVIIYVGKAKNIYKRIQQHVYNLRNKCKDENRHLINA